MLIDRGMDHPGMYSTYFYYETKKQANHAIRHLDGQHLGGTKGLKLTYRGQQRIIVIQKLLRKGNIESSMRKNRDHH